MKPFHKPSATLDAALDIIANRYREKDEKLQKEERETERTGLIHGVCEELKKKVFSFKTTVTTLRMMDLNFSKFLKDPKRDSLLVPHTIWIDDREVYLCFENSNTKSRAVLFLKDIVEIDKEINVDNNNNNNSSSSISDGGSSSSSSMENNETTIYRFVHKFPKRELILIAIPNDLISHVIPTFRYLVYRAHLSFIMNPLPTYLLKKWVSTDLNMNGLIDKKEFLSLSKKMNIQDVAEKKLDDLFQEHSRPDGSMDENGFLKLFDHFLQRPEVSPIFEKYASSKNELGEKIIGINDFASFLEKEQGEKFSLEQCEKYIDQYLKTYNSTADVFLSNKNIDSSSSSSITTNTTTDNTTNTDSTTNTSTTTTTDNTTSTSVTTSSNDNVIKGLTMYQFSRFLFSTKLNSILDKRIYLPHSSDMNHPITDYWIASSHNTYLTGHQLKGDSMVDMYKHVLYTGCRCIELDCYNGSDGEPMITHSIFPTTRLNFKEVVQCINEHAFVKNPYPIILSLEIHTSEKQQEKMAKYMVEIFGDKLLRTKDLENMNPKQFPSPEQLKYKILLKGWAKGREKKAKKTTPEQDNMPFEPSKSMLAIKSGKHNSKDLENYEKEMKPSMVSVSLADIISLPVEKLKFPKDPSSKYYIMHSQAEYKVKNLINNPDATFSTNKKHFLRVFPSPTRIDSSNLNPIIPWELGCQMVAFNYQTLDEFHRLNLIKFIENGRFGYILKPSFLRDQNISFQDVVKSMNPCKLELTVISVENLPKVKMDDEVVEFDKEGVHQTLKPIVEVSLLGSNLFKTKSSAFSLFNFSSSSSSSSTLNPIQKKTSTKTANFNGFTFEWNENFQFIVHCLELAFLRITVYHKATGLRNKQKFIAENIIPLKSIRTGIRCMPLRNADATLIDMCSLLCSIQLTKENK